jgi:hypothetical protein
MKALRHHAACVLLAAASFLASPVYATSYSSDVTDLWWISTESGWGMQLVQEGSTVFATLFIYGLNSQPTWATATLQSEGEGTYVWSGTVYSTTGDYLGAVPFNSADVTVTAVGTMTFQLNTVAQGTLTYSINGVTVTKQVVRESLAYDDYNGTFTIAVHLGATGCNVPSDNGDVAGAMNLVISQTNSNMSMVWTFLNGAVCTYSGSYTQYGKDGEFSGNYSCSSGDLGQMSLIEMTNRPGMISGRISGASTNHGCQYTGYFSGIDPSLPTN